MRVKQPEPSFDDPGRMNAVIDELADLNAVVFHSAAILGVPQRDLLEMAYDKVKGRQTDAEIDEQLNKAADGINDGSQYPGKSYEDGIQAFALWLFGDTDEKPFEE